MTTVKVRFRRSAIAGKKGSLFYSLVHNRKSKQITTKYKVFPFEWNEEAQVMVYRFGRRNKELREIQVMIKKDLEVIENIIEEFENDGDYSLDKVVAQFLDKSFSMSFFIFMDEEIRRLTNSDSLGTARNYRRARSSFSKYLENKDIDLISVTEELAGDYELWLRRKKVSRNTASFYMRILRSVYNKAVERHLVSQNYPFRKVYTGIEHTRKRALPEETIMRLNECDLSSSRTLSYAKDLFLFSFYTRGMSFVDMAYLRKEDIKEGLISYTRRKTGHSMSIRLERCMQEIIERYTGLVKESDYVFPLVTSDDPGKAYSQYQTALTYYNKQLKRLSSILELEVPLTSYVARHSWATMARNRNVPIAVISAGMGHTSEMTTEIYLASVDPAVIDDANRKLIAGIAKKKIRNFEVLGTEKL